MARRYSAAGLDRFYVYHENPGGGQLQDPDKGMN